MGSPACASASAPSVNPTMPKPNLAEALFAKTLLNPRRRRLLFLFFYLHFCIFYFLSFPILVRTLPGTDPFAIGVSFFSFAMYISGD
jgi:hypothetical protein